MWLALWATTVWAAEVLVTVPGPGVRVHLDGVFIDLDSTGTAALASRVSIGEHQVEVLNLTGRKVLATTSVDVRAGERVTLVWDRPVLEVRERGPEGEPLRRVPLPEDTYSDMRAELERFENGGGRGGSVGPRRASPTVGGSLEIDGLPTSGAEVMLDGKLLRQAPDTGTVLLSDIESGPHLLRVKGGGRILFEDNVMITPGVRMRCVVMAVNVGPAVNCQPVFWDPGMNDPRANMLGAPGTAGGWPGASSGVSSAPPRGIAPQGARPVPIRFVRLDAADEGRIYVDGVRMARYRSGGRDVRSVPLMPGVHAVEVRGPDGRIWHRGSLTVALDKPLELHWGYDEGFSVPEQTSAWR